MKLRPALHRLRYFCGDAWDEWRHSPGVNLLALTTLTAALFLAGLVLLMLTSVQARVDWLRADVPIVVYLADDLDANGVETLRSELERLEGVAGVDFIIPISTDQKKEINLLICH